LAQAVEGIRSTTLRRTSGTPAYGPPAFAGFWSAPKDWSQWPTTDKGGVEVAEAVSLFAEIGDEEFEVNSLADELAAAW
jgi:hypothetical protein